MSNGRKTVNTAIGDDIFEEFYLRGWIAKGPDDFGFVSNKISYAPFKFKWFDKKLKQYTLYGVFSKL